jgi:hypothetical protein
LAPIRPWQGDTVDIEHLINQTEPRLNSLPSDIRDVVNRVPACISEGTEAVGATVSARVYWTTRSEIWSWNLTYRYGGYGHWPKFRSEGKDNHLYIRNLEAQTTVQDFPVSLMSRYVNINSKGSSGSASFICQSPSTDSASAT